MKTMKTTIKALVLVFALSGLSLVSGVITKSGSAVLYADENDCGVSDADVLKYLLTEGYTVTSISSANDGSCNRIAGTINLRGERIDVLVVIDENGIVVAEDVGQ